LAKRKNVGELKRKWRDSIGRCVHIQMGETWNPNPVCYAGERDPFRYKDDAHTEGGNLISSSFHKFFFFKKKKKGVDFLLFLLFFFFRDKEREKENELWWDWVVVVGVSSVDLRPADGIVITPTNRRLASSFSSLSLSICYYYPQALSTISRTSIVATK
jgi:hypothetical protein